MKAILELDYMPGNCRECRLCIKYGDEWLCVPKFKFVDTKSYKINTIQDFCPLKKIEE